ncbi:hypothetical protein AVEN_208423-1 [Araneus ventricosus]|uniref:Uncharacterized protein n=1 Tax=Araneus ventricosus TaxID=182803 RepID=A0A4Y2EEP5_ARAVE|nr:hypothetical protein AVEN_208423-1 [Araneus ventricosus]
MSSMESGFELGILRPQSRDLTTRSPGPLKVCWDNANTIKPAKLDLSLPLRYRNFNLNNNTCEPAGVPPLDLIVYIFNMQSIHITSNLICPYGRTNFEPLTDSSEER